MEQEKFISNVNQVLDDNVIREIEQARIQMKENERKGTVIAIIVVLGMLLTIVLEAFLTAERHTEEGMAFVIGIVMMIGTALIIAIIAYNRKYKKCEEGEKYDYNEILQYKILKPLLKLEYNWEYVPEGKISSEEFDEIGIYVYSSFARSGLTYGSILNNYQFKMSNITVYRRRR